MSKHDTAFYIETLIMVVMLMAVCVVILRIFGAARADSRRAELLTQSVILAENTAEEFSSAGDPQALCDLLEGQMTEDNGVYTITASAGTSDDSFELSVVWQQQDDLASGTITVLSGGEEIYSLDTAVYTGGAA